MKYLITILLVSLAVWKAAAAEKTQDPDGKDLFLYLDRPSAQHVKEFNGDDLDFTKHVDKPRVVEFYSPYCGVCQKFKPKYVRLAKKTREEDNAVEFYAVSCAAHSHICRSWEVKGIPAMILLPPGAVTEAILIEPESYHPTNILKAMKGDLDGIRFRITKATDNPDKTQPKKGPSVEQQRKVRQEIQDKRNARQQHKGSQKNPQPQDEDRSQNKAPRQEKEKQPQKNPQPQDEEGAQEKAQPKEEQAKKLQPQEQEAAQKEAQPEEEEAKKQTQPQEEEEARKAQEDQAEARVREQQQQEEQARAREEQQRVSKDDGDDDNQGSDGSDEEPAKTSEELEDEDQQRTDEELDAERRAFEEEEMEKRAYEENDAERRAYEEERRDYPSGDTQDSSDMDIPPIDFEDEAPPDHYLTPEQQREKLNYMLGDTSFDDEDFGDTNSDVESLDPLDSFEGGDDNFLVNAVSSFFDRLPQYSDDEDDDNDYSNDRPQYYEAPQPFVGDDDTALANAIEQEEEQLLAMEREYEEDAPYVRSDYKLIPKDMDKWKEQFAKQRIQLKRKQNLDPLIRTRNGSSNENQMTDAERQEIQKQRERFIRERIKRARESKEDGRIGLKQNKRERVRDKIFRRIPVIKRRYNKTPEQELFSDAALSFVSGLKQGVFNSNMRLEPHRRDALEDWLNFLSVTLPPESGIHFIIGGLLSNINFITERHEHLVAVLDQFPLDENKWSPSCNQNGIGFACGLWKLFHMASVGLAEMRGGLELDNSKQIYSPHDAAEILRNYIGAFLTCDACKNHFLGQYDEGKFRRRERLSSLTTEETTEGWMQFPLWLWEVHNDVNVRVSNEKAAQSVSKKTRQTPQEREIQALFPSMAECFSCFNEDGTWNDDNLYAFLRRRYWDPSEKRSPQDIYMAKYDRLVKKSTSSGQHTSAFLSFCGLAVILWALWAMKNVKRISLPYRGGMLNPYQKVMGAQKVRSA